MRLRAARGRAAVRFGAPCLGARASSGVRKQRWQPALPSAQRSPLSKSRIFSYLQEEGRQQQHQPEQGGRQRRRRRRPASSGQHLPPKRLPSPLAIRPHFGCPASGSMLRLSMSELLGELHPERCTTAGLDFGCALFEQAIACAGATERAAPWGPGQIAARLQMLARPESNTNE